MPEKLFKEVRAFAKKREWSLAETSRSGAELLLQVYPDPPEAPSAKAAWQPPASKTAGWKGLSAAVLRDAAFADSDPHLA